MGTVVEDNLKILLLCIFWLHITYNGYLYFSMSATARRIEGEMDRLEGQEKLNQVKERIRKKKEEAAQERVLMYVRGEKPEPPVETQPLRVVSEAAAKMAEDYLAGRPLEVETKRVKKKAPKDLKHFAQVRCGDAFEASTAPAIAAAPHVSRAFFVLLCS